MVTIYRYDEGSKVYIGQGTANVDPRTGEAQLPRFSTTREPQIGMRNFFDEATQTWVSTPFATEEPEKAEATLPVEQAEDTTPRQPAPARAKGRKKK